MKGQLWIHASLRPYMEVGSPLEVSKRISNSVEPETGTGLDHSDNHKENIF